MPVAFLRDVSCCSGCCCGDRSGGRSDHCWLRPIFIASVKLNWACRCQRRPFCKSGTHFECVVEARARGSVLAVMRSAARGCRGDGCDGGCGGSGCGGGGCVICVKWYAKIFEYKLPICIMLLVRSCFITDKQRIACDGRIVATVGPTNSIFSGVVVDPLIPSFRISARPIICGVVVIKVARPNTASSSTGITFASKSRMLFI